MRIALALTLALLVALPAARAEDEPALAPALEGRTLDAWMFQLRYGNNKQFDEAAAVIEKVGPKAAAAVPGLLDDIVLPDDKRRERLAELIRAIGDAAVPHLVRSLHGAGDQVWAVRLLGERGATSKPHLRKIGQMLTDSYTGIVEAALEAVGRIGPEAGAAIPAVYGTLGRRHPGIRKAALAALARMGPEGKRMLAGPLPPARPPLASAVPPGPSGAAVVLPSDTAKRVALAKNGTPRERWMAVGGLAKPSVPSKLAVPALIAALEDSEHSVRSRAILSLGSHKASAAGALGRLVELGKADENLRSAVLAVLPDLGEASHAQIPWLVELVSDPESSLQAAAALSRMGPSGLAALERLLEHELYWARRIVTRMIAYVPSTDVETRARLLTKSLGDRAGAVRAAAARGIEKIRKAVPGTHAALRKLLADPDEAVRSASARALVRTGYKKVDVVPALIEAATSRTIWNHEHAAELLVRVGAPAVPALGEALATRGETRLVGAAQRLGAEGVPALVRGLESRNTSIARECLEAIYQANRQGEKAMWAIIRLLDHDEGTVRRDAAHALAVYGVKAEPAVPSLIAILGRKTWTGGERAVALRALLAIGRPALPALREFVASHTVMKDVTALLARLEALPTK